MTAATRKRRFRRRAAEVVSNGKPAGVQPTPESLAEHIADVLAEEALTCMPTLVSRTQAAELLGVGKTNIARYEEQIKPYEVEVEGARAPVYVKSGIEALAKTLHR